MKNLEKFGVQELNAVEVVNLDGGLIATNSGGGLLGWALAVLMYVTDNWDDISGGWNQYGNGECLNYNAS